MEARQRQQYVGRSPRTEHIGKRIVRPLTQRMFESVLGDIEEGVAGWRRGAIPDRFLLEMLEDRLRALQHLAEEGPACKALEHAETALCQAILGVSDTINFEQARREMAREETESAGPKSDSGTGFANSYSNSNTKANPKDETEN